LHIVADEHSGKSTDPLPIRARAPMKALGKTLTASASTAALDIGSGADGALEFRGRKEKLQNFCKCKIGICGFEIVGVRRAPASLATPGATMTALARHCARNADSAGWTKK
jgi:hypothetical protein